MPLIAQEWHTLRLRTNKLGERIKALKNSQFFDQEQLRHINKELEEEKAKIDQHISLLNATMTAVEISYKLADND